MDGKYLIINADDFGMCHSYNEAVFSLLEAGKITSSTLMPVTPGRDEAAAWCVKKKIRCVGLHTTLTSEWPSLRWSSLTRRPSLEDGDGFLYRRCEDVWRHARPEDVAAELDAQFAWFSGSGLFFSHADNHMGSVYPLGGPEGPDYLPLVFERCRRYGVGFRMFRRHYWTDGGFLDHAFAQGDIDLAEWLGVPLVDMLYSYPFSSAPEVSYDDFKRDVCALLYAMPAGVNEIYFHPSVDSEEVRGITSTWRRRVWDFRLLMDDDFQYALKDAGLTPVSYRQMQAMRGF